MKLLSRPLLGIFVGLTLLSSMASAQSYDVSLVGGVSFPNISFSRTTVDSLAVVQGTSNLTGAMSFGLLAHYRFKDAWYGITAGVLQTTMGSHIKDVLVAGASNRDYDQKLPYFQFPVIFKWWIHNNVLVGAGGYYAIAAGNVETSGFSNNNNVAFANSRSFGVAKYQESDYGLVVNAEGRLDFSDRWFGAAHLTYLHGLMNISTTGGGTASNSAFLAHVGLGFKF
ncbi:MAG: outer membrane beta-barrel protein [Oligoflexia bacterium]|nr:outer membrane beta-barrel protein [Oligoflexia bacterium]